jgi:hypothetical protein
MTEAEIKRLNALAKKGNKATPEEKAELEQLKAKAAAVKAQEEKKARIAELLAKGEEITTEEQVELDRLLAEVAEAEAAEAAQEPQKAEENTGTFDKAGATSIVTHRDGLKRVWYRDGKEIGVEDAGA